jgi:hypothetical protein
VRDALNRGVRKLRAPAEPGPTPKQRLKEAEQQARRAAQEASLEQAYPRLEAQGRAITMLSLAQEAQVSSTTVNAYLCQRWGTVPQRLERASAQLVQEGAVITVERLAKAARVSERSASDFLHMQHGRRASGASLLNHRRERRHSSMQRVS